MPANRKPQPPTPSQSTHDERGSDGQPSPLWVWVVDKLGPYGSIVLVLAIGVTKHLEAMGELAQAATGLSHVSERMDEAREELTRARLTYERLTYGQSPLPGLPGPVTPSPYGPD